MAKKDELSFKRRDDQQAKDADRTLGPKGYAAGCSALTSEHTDVKLPADRQSLSHLISYLWGTWKARTPLSKKSKQP
jgi:hypothetical protein